MLLQLRENLVIVMDVSYHLIKKNKALTSTNRNADIMKGLEDKSSHRYNYVYSRVIRNCKSNQTTL